MESYKCHVNAYWWSGVSHHKCTSSLPSPRKKVTVGAHREMTLGKESNCRKALKLPDSTQPRSSNLLVFWTQPILLSQLEFPRSRS